MSLLKSSGKKAGTSKPRSWGVLKQDSPFSVREAYKAIRTNLMFSMPGETCKKILITSSFQHEGKSITAINLGIAFAEAGMRVLLIDCDLRLPTDARKLGTASSPGLSNLLVGMCDVEEAVRHLNNGLDLMPAGDIPPNPSELLGSARMEQLIQALSDVYDYIFFDTPPICTVTDAAILSKNISGVLFVACRGVATQDSITDALNQLKIAGAKVIGFVFSRALDEKQKKYESYQHSYEHSYERMAKRTGRRS